MDASLVLSTAGEPLKVRACEGDEEREPERRRIRVETATFVLFIESQHVIPLIAALASAHADATGLSHAVTTSPALDADEAVSDVPW